MNITDHLIQQEHWDNWYTWNPSTLDFLKKVWERVHFRPIPKVFWLGGTFSEVFKKIGGKMHTKKQIYLDKAYSHVQ